MLFSLTPLGWTARAFDDKSVVGSMLGRNAILPPSASSSSPINLNVERYMNRPKLVEALAEVDLLPCKEVSAGGWTHHQLCGKDASGQ